MIYIYMYMIYMTYIYDIYDIHDIYMIYMIYMIYVYICIYIATQPIDKNKNRSSSCTPSSGGHYQHLLGLRAFAQLLSADVLCLLGDLALHLE
jgi:hypothetical protein